MERKNTFWFSLVCAMTFVCAPLLAHATQQGGALPPQAGQPSPPSGWTAQQPPPTPAMEAAERDAHRTIPGAYRLTYTLTEMDGSKRIGSQHYAFVLDPDAPSAHIDLGARIPVYSSGGTSYNYENTGLKMDASLRQFANGIELSTMLVQDELAGNQDSSIAHAPDGTKNLNRTAPIIRQAQLRTVTLLTENKPMIIGQLDKPGSTHSLQVTVELTRLR